MPVPNKWVYAVLLLFVLFLIWSDPGGAGATARVFFDWLGSIIISIFDFIDGLLGDDNPTPNNPQPAPVETPPGDQFNPNPQAN